LKDRHRFAKIPAADSVQTCIHFIEIERLDDVVVSARFQPLDPVADEVAGGEDDDRQRITAAAKFAQEIQAAPIG
jgi:hypothetical protein